MAANTLHTPWQPGETNSLELLYRAGWSWTAISLHVSGIYGNRRTRDACRVKGEGIGISTGQPKVRVPLQLMDDIEDMMILDYSSRRMACELGVEHSTVLRHIRKHAAPQRRVAWLKGGKDRHAKAARQQLAIYHGRATA